MSDDPFVALEAAVAAVEETAARLTRQRESLQDRLQSQTAKAETLQDAKRDELDSESLRADWDQERAAIRERLLRVRDRLAEVSLTIPESPAS